MQGTLKEFSLAEILQLVAVQQKTGLLRVIRREVMLTFYFDHGVLIACRDRRHVAQDPLLGYLLSCGFVDSDAAAALQVRLEATKEDLADVLLADQFLSEEELRQVLEDLAQDLVYRTHGWREGTYQFVSGDEALQGLHHSSPIKIESLLMEAARRGDEWPRLQEKLPSPDILIDAPRAPTTALGPRAYRLLSQLSEAMRLGELVRRARIPSFEVYEIVAHAVDSGLVRILEMPERVHLKPEPVSEAGRGEKKRRRASGAPALPLALPRPAGLGAAILLCVLCLASVRAFESRLVDTPARAQAAELAADEARETCRRNLEVYRALHGRYPRTWVELESEDLASPELLARGLVTYSPAPDGSSYVLGQAVPASP